MRETCCPLTRELRGLAIYSHRDEILVTRCGRAEGHRCFKAKRGIKMTR
jgi:hypothetical protein